MPAIKVPTSFNIDVEFQIPEFYRRLVSLAIDMVIQFFYVRIGIEIYDSIASHSNPFEEGTGYNLWAIELLIFLPLLLYHVLMEIFMNGQSLGKKIMGIRVVSENGGRPSISQFIIRWLLRISDVWIVWLILILMINFLNPISFLGNLNAAIMILAAFGFLITDIVLAVSSAKNQRIGDMLAHTILIRTRSKANIEDTVFQEVEDHYVPSFPQIMQLSDKDINSVKSILETARKKGDFQLASFAADKIKNHLNIQNQMSPFDFLDTVLKDYNYLSTK